MIMRKKEMKVKINLKDIQGLKKIIKEKEVKKLLNRNLLNLLITMKILVRKNILY